jgi:hypothetical protein
VQACGGLTNSTGEGSAPGMSGEDDALPALDDRTRQLIASLIETSVQSALAARAAPSIGDGRVTAGRGPLTESEAIPDPDTAAISAGTGGASEVPVRGRAPGDTNDPPEAGEEEGEDEEDDEGEDIEDADEEDGAGGPQAFTPGWYEARRGRNIPPRFNIPQRFDPQYPVAFPAESVAHFQIFGSGNASVGREGEAGALYSSAAYLTEISNGLAYICGQLESVEALVLRSPTVAIERLRQARRALSDAQLATFGTYELAASRYELLCGLQGASGVADPALLGTFLDAPAAYSSAGRQAFRRQQQQAIKSAAQVAGRRQAHPAASPPSGTSAAGRGGASAHTPAGGRGRSRNRRSSRGGGTPAAGAGGK